MKRLRVLLLLLGVVVLAAGHVILFHGDWGPPDPYPELSRADPAALREIRGLIGDLSGFPMPSSRRRMLARLGEMDDSAPLALLRVILERSEGLPAGAVSTSPSGEDEDYLPLACWLRTNADPVLDDVLVRMLRDGDLHTELRVRVVVALARRGNARAVRPLLVVALDRDETWTLRREVLRLHRIGMPVPELRELLYQPFGGLDSHAAAALALTDDPEAPSLLVEGLVQRSSLSLGPMLAAAALVVARGAPEIETLAQAVLDRGPSIQSEEEKQLGAALARWLEDHPEVRRSEYERALTAYLESDRRRRELALDSYREIEAALEEDIDLAAAAIVLSPYPDRLETNLEQVWRLSEQVRRDIDGVTDPEKIIGAMNRRLLEGRRETAIMPIEPGPSSFVPRVLWDRSGNCLGQTTLYVAVAERLSLPIHAVTTPRHVFARWDDGEFRRNIETQAGGRRLTDEEYATLDGDLRIDPESVTRGVFLDALTRRELLACVLQNRAAIALRHGSHEEAIDLADRALTLDPLSVGSLVARAAARGVIQPEDERIESDLDLARDLHPNCEGSFQVELSVQSYRGRWDLALQAIDHAIEIHPGANSHLVRIRCLQELGRLGDADREIEKLEGFPGTEWLVTLSRYRSRVLREESGWEEAMDREESAVRRHLRVLTAADALLDRDAAEGVAEILARVLDAPDPGDRLRVEALLMRGRARVALDDIDGARSDLASARRHGASPAETLVLDRAIGDR